VTKVAPSDGLVSGGQTIVVSGVGLENPTEVTVGGVDATFEAVSPTQITVQTPPGVPSTVDVQVMTSAGWTAPSPADHFTYN
jgi:uncharacterized protein (TIGR03437 family)